MIQLQAKINIAMAYKAPEGAGGKGGKDSTDADFDEDEGETVPLGGDADQGGDEPGEGERLSGEAGKTSAATEEASVYLHICNF